MKRPKKYCIVLAAACLLSGGLSAPGQAVDPAVRKLAGANGLLARQQYEAARQEFADYLQNYPTSPDAAQARFGLALCAYEQGDYANAIPQLTPLVADKDFSRRQEALAMLGHCYLARSELDKALAPINDLLTLYPKGPQAESAWVNRGQILYRMGNLKDALAIAQAFPKVYPGSGNIATAMYLEALCDHAMGQQAAAVVTLHRLAGAYPNHPQLFDALLLEGQCLESQGDLPEALRIYQKLAADAPVSAKPAAYYAIGMACQQGGRYAAAAENFALILKEYPTSTYAPLARLQAAIVQLRAGDSAGARGALVAIGQQDPPRAATAAYWLAQCDMAEKKFAPARAVLVQLWSAALPEKPQVLFAIAACDLALGNHQAAADGFAKFCVTYPQDPQVPEALYQQALALRQLGKYKESLELCQQVRTAAVVVLLRPAALLAADDLFLLEQYGPAAAALANLPPGAASPAERVHIALRRGQCAYYTRDYASAIALLTPAVTEPAAAGSPLLADAVFLLGDAQLQTGQNADAVATLGRYLTLSQDRQQEATYKLAAAQRAGGDGMAALVTLGGLLKGPLDSSWVQRGWLAYGQIAQQNKRLDEAAGALQKLLAVKPTAELGAPALYTLAQIAMESGKYQDAAGLFAQVTATYPGHELAADAVFQQGAALKEAGQLQPALALFQSYVNHHATGKLVNQARQMAAVCQSGLGQGSQAIAQLTALAGQPATRSDAVLYDLAWAQRGARDNTAALATYGQLLREFPNSARTAAVQVEAAELFCQEQQYNVALNLLRSVVAGPSAAARPRLIAEYRIGLCYAGLKQPADAAAAFDAFAAGHAADPMAPAALYQSALAWISLNKLEEAQKRLAAILATYPKDASANLATLKIGELQNQGGDYAGARTTFTAWLKDHAKESLTPLAWFGMGWALENETKYEEARAWYTKVLDGEVSPTAARAQFQIGETWFAQKKFDVAAKELLKVDILYTYPEWSARALYEAGRCFEQLKQIDQARTQYTGCLHKFKDSDVAPLARKRLDALGGT